MKFKIKGRRIIRDDDGESKSSSSSSSSSSTVASIDHLLTSILLRLPIISLIRFKLVSKQWYTLITDPHFCRLQHRNQKPNPAVGLFLYFSNFALSPRYQYIPYSLNKPPKQQFRTLEFATHGSGIGILHSCNGLMLCCTYHDARPFLNRRYYVYNPTTGRFSTLPNISSNTKSIRGMNLAFDHDKCLHYKVVCVLGLEACRHQIEVYSSERGGWSKCGEPFAAAAAHIDFKKGVYWNGAMHWLGDSGGDSLYFELDSEMVRNLALPPLHGYPYWSTFYLGESSDHLHYVEISGRSVEFGVYEVKRDYSEWFIKYEVDLSCVAASYPEMVGDDYEAVFSVIGVIRGEREADSFLVIQIPGRMVRWNLVYKTFETIHEFGGAQLDAAEPKGFQHIHSLSCV